MEVKNQMMDQLLVNTTAQAGANQSAKAPKDPEHPDFDSMVTQKRAEKPTAKAEKPAQKPEAKPEDGAETPVVSDEQYAIAAAMMFQAQPDLRVAVPETQEAQIEPEVEAAQPVGPQTPIEQAQIPVETRQDVQTTQETTEPEAQSAGTETTAEPTAVETAETPRTERRTETKPEAPAEKHEAERPARQTAPAEARGEETRTEKAPEAPRIARDGERTEDDETDDAQSVQTAPLFERVDAAPVKVAEASRPIPLEAEDGAAQLGEELGDVLVNSVDANRIEVTLTPDNLGKLTVEISRGENGALNIVLHPSTERAAHLLERHTGDLQNALAASTRSDAQVQIRPAEEPQQQPLDPNGQQRQQQQQQQQQRRQENRNAQDFLQQLRLGLVDVDGGER